MFSRDDNKLIRVRDLKRIIVESTSDSVHLDPDMVAPLFAKIDDLEDASVMQLNKGQLRLFNDKYNGECGVHYESPDGDIADVVMCKHTPSDENDLEVSTYDNIYSEDRTDCFGINSEDFAKACDGTSDDD